MKSFKILIAAVAVTAVLFSGCKKEPVFTGVDSTKAGVTDFTYDETMSSPTSISLVWNPQKALDAGATSISVEQEFFINLLYSNLASLVKASADSEIKENSKPDNRFRYQANRAYIIGRLKDIFTPVLVGEKPYSEFDDLFRMAARNRSQIQPGRQSPRKRVKRDRTHFKNRKTAVTERK